MTVYESCASRLAVLQYEGLEVRGEAVGVEEEVGVA